MTVNLETVVKQLADSGIIAPGKLENFVPPKAHPASVEELLAELVKQNQLTRFQAVQVAAGKAKALGLGGYTILDKIGSGGMGQVFKAYHRRMDRLVAIKMLPPAMTKDAAALARFQREVVAAAKLRHPNIVAADDAAEAGGVHFLVMEYVEGRDLSALVKKDGPLTVGKAVDCILQAARGLEFAHGEGVIHRDIKPSNLLLDKKGTVKILDMGLARIEPTGDAATQAEITGSGAVMGTVDYMAPEQALDSHHADARADIYSLGISLYYLIAGKAPYSGESLAAKLVAHREQPIPSLRAMQPDVPEQLDVVFQKMVAKKADNRYQTMGEVAQAMGAIQSAMQGAPQSLASTAAWNPPMAEGNTTPAAGSVAGATRPLAAITQVVASEKSKHFLAKVVGGAFATIIAPLFVAILMKSMDKSDPPSSLPAVAVTAASPVAVDPVDKLPPDQWIKAVAALPGVKQAEAVARRLQQLNPGFDGKVTSSVAGSDVTMFGFSAEEVTDISPLRALPKLSELNCTGNRASNNYKGKLSDLSPLSGMKLTKFNCHNTQVSDLSPLAGMPLAELMLNNTNVSNLSPLKGMPLEELNFGGTDVSDLSPLAGMPLKNLQCGNSNVADLTPLERCTSLEILKIGRSRISAARLAALQKALPNCKFEKASSHAPLVATGVTSASPAPSVSGDATSALDKLPFDQWTKAVALLPAVKQADAVGKRLQQLNPGFDGDTKATIVGGVVTGIAFNTKQVVDISPVRALPGLSELHCGGGRGGKGKLSDLSPLAGMKLSKLNCSFSQVSDLSPVRGMPLVNLSAEGTNVSDLSPLREMPLVELRCSGGGGITDLSPLRGMPLEYVVLMGVTSISELEQLKECKHLQTLRLGKNKIAPADIAALQKTLAGCKIVLGDESGTTQPARSRAGKK